MFVHSPCSSCKRYARGNRIFQSRDRNTNGWISHTTRSTPIDLEIGGMDLPALYFVQDGGMHSEDTVLVKIPMQVQAITLSGDLHVKTFHSF